MKPRLKNYRVYIGTSYYCVSAPNVRLAVKKAKEIARLVFHNKHPVVHRVQLVLFSTERDLKHFPV